MADNIARSMAKEAKRTSDGMVKNVDNRFAQLTTQQQQEAEVIEARGEKVSLKERLDDEELKLDSIVPYKVDYINVKQGGAIGDGITDDSPYFTQLKGVVLPDESTYAINKATIMGLNRKFVLGTGKIKWKDFNVSLSHSLEGFNNDEVDGTIPMDKINDDIYLSMNLPCESVTSISYRVNAGIMYDMSSEHSQIMGTGTIYKNPNLTLPNNFTLCLGKMKTFVLYKNNPQWVLEDEIPYPAGFKLYHETWNNTSLSIDDKITYHNDHVEIALTNTVFNGYILHFWSNYVSNIDYSNFLAVAVAFDYWIKEETLDDYFVSGVACDFKDANGSFESIKQSFFSRYMFVKHKKGTLWGHNVSNSNYDDYVDSKYLLYLYEKPVDTSQRLNIISTKTNENNNSDFVYNSSRGALYSKTDSLSNTFDSRTEINPVKRLNLPVNLLGSSANLLLASITVSARCLYLLKISLWGGISNDTSSSFFAADFLVRIRTGTNPEASITEISNKSLSRNNLLKVEINNGTYNIYVSSVSSYEQVQALVSYIHSDSINVLTFNKNYFKAYNGYNSTDSSLWSTTALTGIVTAFTKV